MPIRCPPYRRSTLVLRVFGIQKDSLVNGTGIRIVVYLQGCNLACPDCHNPDSHSLSGGYELESAEALTEYLTPLTNGLTITGGEPTLQMGAVEELLNWAARHGLHTMLYTGLTDERAYDILKDVRGLDLIKTGPYIKEKRDLNRPYGSKNQRIEVFRAFKDRILRSRGDREDHPSGNAISYVDVGTGNEYYTQCT